MELVRHLLGRWVESADPVTGEIRWRYVYGGVAKPYLHPLHTPAGAPLTGFQPHGHPWHRGLWFTIKYVNGENFWEEGDEAGDGWGTQRTVAPPTVRHTGAGGTELGSELAWMRPDGETVVLHEARTIELHPVDPVAAGGAVAGAALAVDVAVSLTAEGDLTLDRTPYTTWGGYGGLALRLTRACRRSRMLLPDGSVTERPTGEQAAWCDLSGDLDGGERASGGVAVFDHPSNPRHPSPWYGAAGSMNFLNAAFLFEEAMLLRRGERLDFRYRVLVHDERWEVDRLQGAYDAWVAGG